MQVYLKKILFINIKFLKDKKIERNINKNKQKSLRINKRRRLVKKIVQKNKEARI